jgi:hypothetical protein
LSEAFKSNNKLFGRTLAAAGTAMFATKPPAGSNADPWAGARKEGVIDIWGQACSRVDSPTVDSGCLKSRRSDPSQLDQN